MNIALNAGAVDHGNDILNRAGGFAGYTGHGIGSLFFARETECGRHFGIIDHGLGIRFAPGEAAATSLGAGQNFQHGLDLGVGLNGKFMGRQGQSDAEKTDRYIPERPGRPGRV